MTNPSKIDQSEAQAGGDIVAGDKSVIYNQVSETGISRLLQQLVKDRENDDQFKSLLDELSHYCSSLDRIPVGLETKLKNGGREDLFPAASREKELFAKRLARDQLYRSGQELYTFILGRIHDRFTASIPVLFEEKASAARIDAAIVELVVEPVLRELGTNEVSLSSIHLKGMVYFLTGNCFLKWVE